MIIRPWEIKRADWNACGGENIMRFSDLSCREQSLIRRKLSVICHDPDILTVNDVGEYLGVDFDRRTLEPSWDHLDIVESALQRGQTVPLDVLADYTELIKTRVLS